MGEAGPNYWSNGKNKKNLILEVCKICGKEGTGDRDCERAISLNYRQECPYYKRVKHPIVLG